jgi:NAD(P)H-dependent FMN reductase
MAGVTKVLVFAGSTRRASFNKQLAAVAAAHSRSAGAEVTLLDLATLPLPLYDGDLEAEHGLPANAVQLKALFIQHQALVIASPEYNSSISGVLKNAIDWVSRPVPGEAPLVAFRGKVAGLLSASPGALGGLRGLVHLRAILGNIGVLVLPDQVAVSRADGAFGADGKLSDAATDGKVGKLAREVVETARRLAT